MTDEQRIRFANRFFSVALLALALGLLWVLLEIFTAGRAHARDLTITYGVPTVSGIEASPSPLPYYRRGPVVREAPSAGIYELGAVAPPNGCPRPAFRVISGSPEGRGCFGQQ